VVDLYVGGFFDGSFLERIVLFYGSHFGFEVAVLVDNQKVLGIDVFIVKACGIKQFVDSSANVNIGKQPGG